MRFKLACIAGLGLAVGPLAFAGEMAQSEALGRDLYALHCASCHGANLEGQPNGCGACHRGGSRRRRTTRPGTPGIIRMLFRIVKEGTAAVVGQGYESEMPAFAGILSDQQIRDVLAFIKSTWSERERAFQAGASRWEAEGGR